MKVFFLKRKAWACSVFVIPAFRRTRCFLQSGLEEWVKYIFVNKKVCIKNIYSLKKLRFSVLKKSVKKVIKDLVWV